MRIEPLQLELMTINESIIEGAVLEWFEELGYAALHGPMLAPGEPTAGGGIRLVMWVPFRTVA